MRKCAFGFSQLKDKKLIEAENVGDDGKPGVMFGYLSFFVAILLD